MKNITIFRHGHGKAYKTIFEKLMQNNAVFAQLFPEVFQQHEVDLACYFVIKLDRVKKHLKYFYGDYLQSSFFLENSSYLMFPFILHTVGKANKFAKTQVRSFLMILK